MRTMGEVINLRQARKAKARAEKEAQAQENRVRFGRTGAEKQRDTDAAERDARRHDGHRIDEDEDPDGGAA
jgi:hypothetical protein